ncbi:DHA2 family efflux MFS transporter permease subunit [Rhizobium cauense]|uniref:DHA2 family efflux MFS transporter permease subunit n=1 Tax=Rhizobium cauense TaxID=1166683 RepID=UPI001C6F2D89|nr:DHA2 family efflux MFS transporter permease subunit [Rhizobium cauense]MBW9114013.1 DHA2 family efflux MFS transporter permease subunit [Rhizobium cauense]
MSEQIEPTSFRAPSAVLWVGFIAMCIGMFMAILDVQVVATSLPTIQQAINIDPDQMSWIQTVYLIAEVVAIPLTGLLTRVLTMRWLFVASIGLFVVASAGCAASNNFGELIAWRILQGFSGGTLIPSVFSAVFILFPNERQAIATTIAGVLAVLAPTVGPIIGGWLTSTYSWHWLFLINIAPGIISALLAWRLLPRQNGSGSELRELDGLSLVMMALALTSLELGLKEAPTQGWLSPYVLGLLLASLSCGAWFASRSLRKARPIVELRHFRDRNFLVGSALSFLLGIGLFGSVYLIPVFLAFIRGHNALEIGTTMLVTGVTQLIVAPIAVALEKRTDPRLLSAVGFAVFAFGLGMSALQDPRSDYDAMFWPQVVRGAAIMFCLLPPTRLALGSLPPAQVPDASGLFNLMRNLGGAIGIAMIDTIIYTRSEPLEQRLWDELRAGDAATAAFVGAPAGTINSAKGTLGPDAIAMLDPLVQTAASVQAINEAWLIIALLTGCALLFLPFAKPEHRPSFDHPR